MKKDFSISIVIPSFQAESTIQRAIESVVHDALVNEVLVMDDGSTDDTGKVVRSMANPKIYFESAPNQGACHARNRGLRSATSTYVLFLDADDYVEEGYIEQLREAVSSSPDVIVVGHRHIDSNGYQIRTVTYNNKIEGWDLLAEYLNNPIQTSGFIWRREWLLEGGGWDESLPIFQDAEISIRMLLRKPTAYIIDRPKSLAVWVEIISNTRITTNITVAKMGAVYRGLTLHKDSIVETGNIKAKYGLAHRLYELARKCYARGYNDIGDLSMAAVRGLGIKGHIGSYGHRVASNILGLRIKMRLSSTASSIYKKYLTVIVTKKI